MEMACVPVLKDSFEYHVFIAHSSEDTDVLIGLVNKLEKQTFKCFLYERDLSPAANIVRDLSRIIQKSRRVLLFMSKDFIASQWSQFEAMEAIQKQYIDKWIVLIPVLYKLKCDEIPDYLRPYRCIEYCDKDFETLLLKALTIDIKVTDRIPAGDIANGLVWSYFFGYLNLVLPGMTERSEKWLKEQENKPEMLKKMVIIVPKTGQCPEKFPTYFTHKGFIEFNTSRAGNVSRSYKSSVYKVEDPVSKEEYLFIAEFATPMMSMWEMENSDVAGLTVEEKCHQRMIFGSKLQEILLHPMSKDCHYKSTYLEYDDSEGMDDLPEKLCDHIRNELKKEKHRQNCLDELNED